MRPDFLRQSDFARQRGTDVSGETEQSVQDCMRRQHGRRVTSDTINREGLAHLAMWFEGARLDAAKVNRPVALADLA